MKLRKHPFIPGGIAVPTAAGRDPFGSRPGKHAAGHQRPKAGKKADTWHAGRRDKRRRAGGRGRRP